MNVLFTARAKPLARAEHSIRGSRLVARGSRLAASSSRLSARAANRTFYSRLKPNRSRANRSCARARGEHSIRGTRLEPRIEHSIPGSRLEPQIECSICSICSIRSSSPFLGSAIMDRHERVIFERGETVLR